ncbi:hypothetical protein ANN_06724 [Periplaneta americana]|uniref:Uncharacterized protein n=1 Tax=Periplaneta americana TaxID=6978 RepID=A0ABQ8TEF8_PERAM|nr:hypothetical protein ANN_06724 [Periplaneta americana]
MLNTFVLNEVTFEKVSRFRYLGSIVTEDNNILTEIKDKVAIGNRSLRALDKIIRTSYISKKMKVRIYKTIIKPTVTFGSETWTLPERAITILNTWERKILRKIYGPIYDKGEWRIRTNSELQKLYKDSSIVTDIKIRRLEWLGHIIRMDNNNIPKRLLDATLSGKRRAGRPKLRWLDDVQDDLVKAGIKRWRRRALEREDGAAILKEVKAKLKGLVGADYWQCVRLEAILTIGTFRVALSDGGGGGGVTTCVKRENLPALQKRLTPVQVRKLVCVRNGRQSRIIRPQQMDNQRSSQSDSVENSLKVPRIVLELNVANVPYLHSENMAILVVDKMLRKIFGAKRNEVTGEWRKLHNAELHVLHSSLNITRNIKSRRLRWEGYFARMDESRNAYRLLVMRREGKRPLGRPRRRWEDNINIDLREVGYDARDWINLAQDRGRWRIYIRAGHALINSIHMGLSTVSSELSSSLLARIASRDRLQVFFLQDSVPAHNAAVTWEYLDKECPQRRIGTN